MAQNYYTMGVAVGGYDNDGFEKKSGLAAAFGDIDNDVDLDIAVSNLVQGAYVLRNDSGNRRNWLGIQTMGTKSNRDGIGCRVKVVSASGLAQAAWAAIRLRSWSKSGGRQELSRDSRMSRLDRCGRRQSQPRDEVRQDDCDMQLAMVGDPW